jgi:hypothetical protein
MGSSYNFFTRDGSWLVGWESISRYTGCSVSTLRRLKDEDGMPIRVLSSGTIVALGPELDLWLIYFNDGLEEERKKKGDPK